MSPPTTDPVKLEVTLKYATVSEFDARFAANVASDTVFLKTPKPKPVGTVVSLELHLAGGEIALAGQGPVVCAFEGASVPEGRQPGMIIAITPLDEASAKRVRAIVVKYGQGRNAVLPPGVQKPAVAAAPAAAPPRAPAEGLGDLLPDLDAAIQGLGAGDQIQSLAPPIAGPPPVIVSSASQDLMDPGPGLVLRPAGPPPPAPPAPVPTMPAAPVAPIPALAPAAEAELGASSWTSELDAALGTAFDLDTALPTPPAPAAPRPLPRPPAPAAPRPPQPRSLEGMFGPPQTVSTEPAGLRMPAERAFSMPPPAPAPTPMEGVPKVDPVVPAAPAEPVSAAAEAAPSAAAAQAPSAAPADDDMLAPQPQQGFWLGAEPEESAAPTRAAPAVPTGEPAAAPAASTGAGDDDMLAPEAAGVFAEDAAAAAAAQVAHDDNPASDVVSTQVNFEPPDLEIASSVPDAALQAIAEGMAPVEIKPAFKPEDALPKPIVVSAPRRAVDDEAALRVGNLPREEAASPGDEAAPALVGAIVGEEPGAPTAAADAASAGPAPSAFQGQPEVTAPLPRAHSEEPELTAPVRARPRPAALSGRALGIAAGAGAIVGLLLFLLLRLVFAEPEHVVRFRQANDLVRAGKSAEAIPLYQSILVSNPEFTLAKRHLAVALSLTGQREQAESLLRSYVGTSEDLADVETVKKYLGEAEPNLVE